LSTVQVEKKDMENLREYTHNTQWLLENMEHLRDKYPDNYIAVCDSAKSVIHGKTMEELLDKLTKRGKEPSTCAIDFISHDKYVLIV
jgi:ribonuclease HIII